MALLVGVIVLAGYLATMAPTVTFWDAGEFIAAARTLGVPHPPGTPLFVLYTNVWSRLVPLGTFAWRVNLFSAVCSTAAAALWCVVACDLIARLHPDIGERSRRTLSFVGGAAAALLGAFSYSTWQNATEAEVYAVAALTTALVAWAALRWRAIRCDRSGAAVLLLALYFLALAVGEHPMGVLVGPAFVALLIAESWQHPLPDSDAARDERSSIALIGGAVMLLAGIAVGNPVFLAMGGLALGVALVWACRVGNARFALMACIAIVVGVSSLLFLLLRARQHPWLNAGNPDTWRRLVDVVRRAQYPPRTPFDDPLLPHGSANTGRTFTVLLYQVGNYFQYFDWQWARSLGDWARPSVPRIAITLGMATLGIRGAFAQRRRDVSGFALLMTLFVVTGPLLLLYLNFKPGQSVGWNVWPHYEDHEVRDRDYFFVASFVVWGIWVAIALVDLVREAMPRVRASLRPMVLALFGVALVPLVGNYHDADRRTAPDNTFARDFAVALLQSAPPNAILLTRGDNATFPLWYLQNVEHVRRDVTLISLDLLQTPWYTIALAQLPHHDAERAELATPWRDTRLVPVTAPVHRMADSIVERFGSFWATAEYQVPIADFGVASVAKGAVVQPLEVSLFEILRENAGRRPIAWALPASDAMYGLGHGMVQQGLALVMPVGVVDSTHLAFGAAAGPNGIPLDVAATRALVDSVWEFGRLERGGSGDLDVSVRAVAAAVTGPMTQLGIALALRGDTVAARHELERAIRISGDSIARATLARWR